ncbi:MAG: FAD:protein FMN transferase [Clostridiales bacterium]|nr:FAD:protein FMN transferase [Clostridiales bacterium]
MRRRQLTCILLTLLLLTGCTYSTGGGADASEADPEAAKSSTEYLEAMDTYMTLTAYGSHREEALEEACAEIRRLEALLSTGSQDSEVYALNQSGSAVLSDDTAALVEYALRLYDSTGGAFDITVYPLMELWGFTTQDYQVPTAEALAETLALVGSDRLTYDSDTQTLTLAQGQAVDFGGIAKGYTSQRVMELFLEAGVSSAMVSLGGNIHCLGTKPDGSLWRIGIQDPFGEDGDIAAVVSVADQAVITSGGYQRFFQDEDTGETYHHIIDPATGCPAKSGLASVSIVTGDGTLGDGLSTALYIMGLEEATAYWQAHSGEFQAIFIDDDGAIYVTEGIADEVTADAGFTVLTAE